MIKYKLTIILIVLFFVGMIIAISTYAIGDQYNVVGVIMSASTILLCLPACFLDNIIDTRLEDKEKKKTKMEKQKAIKEQAKMELEKKKLELEKEKIKLESLKTEKSVVIDSGTIPKKYCRFCGEEIDKNAKVCPLCGNDL